MDFNVNNRDRSRNIFIRKKAPAQTKEKEFTTEERKALDLLSKVSGNGFVVLCIQRAIGRNTQSSFRQLITMLQDNNLHTRDEILKILGEECYGAVMAL